MKPSGIRVKFVETVLGWQWLENHLGTSHWQGPDGRCYTVLPEFVFTMRPDQLKALISHETQRREAYRKAGLGLVK